MVTKKIISDQILLRLYGGYRDTNAPVDERDIWRALEELINTVLKSQHFSQTLPSGETIPENLMIGIYENVATISTTTGKSKAVLPITPISLPRNLGIYQIYDSQHPDSPFIPLLAGQKALLKTDALLSDLLGQVSYEPKGTTIIFNKDLPLYGISSITMELIVMDISLYGINDILPIPADYTAGIIEQLMTIFSAVVAEDAEVNPYTNAGQQTTLTNPQRK
jgi:hypothetical protein